MGTPEKDRSTYCRRCSYDLRGIGTPSKCPECGRPFDLSNPKTFLSRRPRKFWRALRWVVYSLVLILLACSATVAWLWWDWRLEQPALAWAGAHRVVSLRWDREPEFSSRLVFVLNRDTYGYGPLSGMRRIAPDWLYMRAGRWSYLLWRADNLSAKCELPVTAGEAPLSRLKRLRCMELVGPGIGDAVMGEVGQLRALTDLNLAYTAVTDDGLARLGGCQRLQCLDLRHSRVGGQGLAALANHPKLTYLDLTWTPTDDRAVPVLKDLKNLESLYLYGTRITPERIAELKSALPACSVRAPEPDAR